MNSLYNTQKDITSKIETFLNENTPCLHKTQRNIIPSVIYGMISSESVVTLDIARNLKDDFSNVQLDSITRRIRRLLNNKRFDGYLFYKQIIQTVIDKYYVKHSNKKIHLIIDHMYSKEHYTVLLISMRVGKQGIPIYFECFEGNNNPLAFQDSTIIKAINSTYQLFKDKDCTLVFLADRWFNSKNILSYIKEIGCLYAFRFKGNIKISVYDKQRKRYVEKHTSDLKSSTYHSYYYHDVYMYDDFSFKSDVAISRKHMTDEPWIIVTNESPNESIRDYSHRFGGIETIFKNQKSNGFYLEDITTASLRSFINLYSLVCFSILFLTILGADYSKNSRCYKNVKITTHKNYKKKGKVRVMSLFHTGLTLFKLAINSSKYIRIPFKMILYDI